MKKTKYMIIICSLLLLSGCVKSNTTMTINKNKSMSLSSDILISDMINDDKNKLIIKEEKDKLQKKGIIIENIESSNGYSGFSVTKKYDNIDKVSSTELKEINISNFLSEDFDDSVLFQVEKGLFKNIYTANYIFKVDDDSFSNSDESTNNENVVGDNNVANNTTVADESVSMTNNNDNNSSNDLLKLMSEMEFKYIVKLPYKVLESNSTLKSDGDKTLEWDLSTNDTVIINYSFELYNMNNIYMVIGIFIGTIILFIILIIIKNKIIQKRKDIINSKPILKEYDPSIENEIFNGTTSEKLSNLKNDTVVNNSVNNKKENNISNVSIELEKTQIINIPDDIK